MSEPRNQEAIAQRWNWTGWGYEDGFPRGCQFTDIDAATEFNRRRLLVEAKHHTNGDPFPPLSRGQELFYKNELRAANTTVLVLYGDELCNNPLGVYDLRRDQWFDWREHHLDERRRQLKRHINRAMGLPQPPKLDENLCKCGSRLIPNADGYCELCEPF